MCENLNTQSNRRTTRRTNTSTKEIDTPDMKGLEGDAGEPSRQELLNFLKEMSIENNERQAKFDLLDERFTILEEKFDSVNSGTNARIQSLEQKLSDQEIQVGELRDHVKSLREELKSVQATVKDQREEVGNLCKDMDEMKEIVDKTKTDLKNTKKDVDASVEAKKRRTIYVTWIKELNGEKVYNVIQDMFNDIEMSEFRVASTESIFRRGERRDGRVRPIVINCSTMAQKNAVYSQVHNLKKTERWRNVQLSDERTR